MKVFVHVHTTLPQLNNVRFYERHSCCSSRVSFRSVAPLIHFFYQLGPFLALLFTTTAFSIWAQIRPTGSTCGVPLAKKKKGGTGIGQNLMNHGRENVLGAVLGLEKKIKWHWILGIWMASQIARCLQCVHNNNIESSNSVMDKRRTSHSYMFCCLVVKKIWEKNDNVAMKRQRKFVHKS